MIRDPDTGAVRFFGLYRGIVADNRDPIGKHRVRLQVPQVLSQAVTDWAYPLETAGVSAPTPLVGQGVWVQFEGGDPSYPVWTGTFGSSTTQLTLTLEQLADVSVVNPQDGMLLSYSAATHHWVAAAVLPATVINGTAVTRSDVGTVTNALLANSSVTINGSTVALGGAVTVRAEPTDGSVTTAKLVSGAVTNAMISTPWVTVNGSQVSLGSATTITATPTAGSVTSASIVSGGLPTTSITNFDSVIKAYRLDQFAAPTTNVGLNGSILQNAGTPVNANDVATKGYTDALVAGLNYKKEVRVATTGSNVVLSGTQTIDGIALAVGDRVLVKDQTTGSQNGIYVVAAGAWARSSDGTTMGAGTYIYVDQGTLFSDAAFVLTTNDPITVGTTSLTFVQFSGAGQIVPGNGISKTGNQLSVVGTAGRVSVSSGSVDIDAGYIGQTSITTLGTIIAGTWNGSTVQVAKGGTGATSIAAGYVKGNGTAALSSVTTIPATDVTGLPAVAAPTGAITMFAATAVPSGWLRCDGTLVSRTTYSALFAVVGTTYGAGDGSTTFALPNLLGRVPAGYDTAQTEFNALGKTGGEKTHLLTTAEIPAHQHTVNQIGYNGASDYPGSRFQVGFGGTRNTLNDITTEAQGGGGAHNNLQPYLSLNFIIKT